MAELGWSAGRRKKDFVVPDYRNSEGKYCAMAGTSGTVLYHSLIVFRVYGGLGFRFCKPLNP